MDTSFNPPVRSRARALVATLCIVVLAACSSLPDNSARVASHSLPAQGTALADSLQPMLEQHEGKSGFRLLVEGEEAYAARLQLIRAAERSLDVQYYIWHNDLTGQVAHHQLLAAADRGVRVRLLLDDLDTAGKDQLLRRIDAHPNLEIRLFNPFANRNNRVGDFAGDTRRVNRRMHNKTLTADGIATIFGGRNIGDEYFDATAEVAFGDMDALGVGPIAAEVSSQFDLYWNSPYSYPLTAFDWDEPVTDAEVAAFREENNAFVAGAADSEYVRILKSVEMAKAASMATVGFVWSDWHLGYDQPRAIEMDEITEETHLAAKIIKAMDLAEEELIIVSPYFVPGENFTDYLVGLVEKGVRVRILTNSLQANDVALVHAGYMRYREDLVRGGVELYEFRATSNKIRRRMERERIDVEKTSLHAKIFTIDSRWIFVGSFNLDGRSAKLNTELGAYFASPVEASQFSDTFDAFMREAAYRLELDERGKLRWIGYNGTEQLSLDTEPDTSWWKRTSTRMLSWFVPESQL